MDRLSRINMLLAMIEKEPNDIFSNYALAIEYQAEENLEVAKQQFLKVLDMDVNYLPCYYQLGQLLEKLNEHDKAINYYRAGLGIAKEQGNQKAINEINEAIWLLED